MSPPTPPPDHTFRCVLCFSVVRWADGVDDEVERVILANVDERVFCDAGLSRRNRRHRRILRRLARRGRCRPLPVSDGGTCAECWTALGADRLAASVAVHP